MTWGLVEELVAQSAEQASGAAGAGSDGRIKRDALIDVLERIGVLAHVAGGQGNRAIDGFAIGQVSELDGFAGDVNVERGRIVVEDITLATSQWGVFAAGDAATGPASVVAAIAGGRECASPSTACS